MAYWWGQEDGGADEKQGRGWPFLPALMRGEDGTTQAHGCTSLTALGVHERSAHACCRLKRGYQRPVASCEGYVEWRLSTRRCLS
jgi:hypothetical protein